MNNLPTSICLFCGPKATSFKRLEHPIPESLGNKIFIVRKAVCDGCNQYFSKLDNYFVHYHFTSPARFVTLEETKKGNPPMQALIQGEARRSDDGKINLTQRVLAGKENEQLTITFTGNDVTVKGSFILPETDTKKLSRFLAKCGLETLYIKRGALAFAKEFNRIREYARYGQGLKFIPFLWGSQTERQCDLLLATITDKKIEGPFYFATIFVPGSVYFLPLNRFGDNTVIDKLATLYPLTKIMEPTMARREPIRYEIRVG